MKTKTVNMLLASAVALTVAGSAQAMNMSPDENSKMCFGVAKAGANDCASADKAHGCAGSAAEDASGIEWISVPKGLCERLAGGSLTPIEPEAAADEAHTGDSSEE